MPFLGTSGIVTFLFLFLAASAGHCLVVDPPSGSQSFDTQSAVASTPQPSSPSSTISSPSQYSTTVPTSLSSAQDTVPTAIAPTFTINPFAPVTASPTEATEQHEAPFNNIPHALSSATALVAPSQLTEQAQSTPTTNPADQSPPDSPIDQPAPSTPQISPLGPSEAASPAPQDKTSSAPQAETQNGVASEVGSPSQPGGQLQSSNGPSAESLSEPQAQGQSQGTSQTGPSNQSKATMQDQGNAAGAPSSQSDSGPHAQGGTQGGSSSQSGVSTPDNSNPQGGFSEQSKEGAPSGQSSVVSQGPDTVQTGSPSQSPGGTQALDDSQGQGFIVASGVLEATTQPTKADFAGSPFTVGNEVVTPNSASQYIFHDHTLVPGGPAMTIAGSLVSLAPYATQVAIGSDTITLQGAQAKTPPTLTIEGQIVTANSASQYVFGGQTLTPGGTGKIISGIMISIPTISSPPQPTKGLIDAGTASYPYSINAAGDIMLASQTLTPGGPPITAGDTIISEASDGSYVVIVSGGSTKTEALNLRISTTSTTNVRGHVSSLAGTGLGSNLNSSATLAFDTAITSSATPLEKLASPTLPMVNPTTTKASMAPKELGNAGERLILSAVVAFLAANTV